MKDVFEDAGIAVTQENKKKIDRPGHAQHSECIVQTVLACVEKSERANQDRRWDQGPVCKAAEEKTHTSP
jgi:hypothetical protein